jgi:hypothetical protein
MAVTGVQDIATWATVEWVDMEWDTAWGENVARF